MTPKSVEDIDLKSGGTAHVFAPHPDDFDAIAVTMKFLLSLRWKIVLSVMTGGENGVIDGYKGATSRDEKRDLRRQEQRDSCKAFGLAPECLNFLDLDHDETGLLQLNSANAELLNSQMNASDPQLLLMPHISDSNRTHQICAGLALHALSQKPRDLQIWFNRDEKTLEMQDELYTAFDERQAQWKAELLRLHSSQQHRNLELRGVGFDERVLDMNRRTANSLGLTAKDSEGNAQPIEYAETFEVCHDAADKARRLKLSSLPPAS